MRSLRTDLSTTVTEQMEVVGAGALRGIVLHKLMEEFLTGELEVEETQVASRADELLVQLLTDADGNPASLLARIPEQGEAVHEGRSS